MNSPFSAQFPQEKIPTPSGAAMVPIGETGEHPWDRWPIYFRLQELGIPCRCRCHGPLEAAIATPLQALQVWSVVHRYRTTRPQLATWLDTCWALPSRR